MAAVGTRWHIAVESSPLARPRWSLGGGALMTKFGHFGASLRTIPGKTRSLGAWCFVQNHHHHHQTLVRNSVFEDLRLPKFCSI